MAHTKIYFKYNESGKEYEVESMWANSGSGGYEIDNIPFYARGVALGDLVSAEPGPDGELWFDQLIKPSGHSTIRIAFGREKDVQQLRDELRVMGCDSELSDSPRLVAVDVPPNVPYSLVKAKLEEGQRDDKFEYEEGCLGQPRPPDQT